MLIIAAIIKSVLNINKSGKCKGWKWMKGKYGGALWLHNGASGSYFKSWNYWLDPTKHTWKADFSKKLENLDQTDLKTTKLLK